MPRAVHVPVEMSRRADADPEEVENAVLDALVAGPEAGMTIFEIRSHVDYDIEAIEPALAHLRDKGKITIEYGEDRSVIHAADHVSGKSRQQDSPTWIERIKRTIFGS